MQMESPTERVFVLLHCAHWADTARCAARGATNSLRAQGLSLVRHFHRSLTNVRLECARPRLVRGESLARHHHTLPYATVILEGGYEEAGDGGRWRVRAGDVLIHAPFAAHRNFSLRGARLVNLPLPVFGGVSVCGCIDDPEGIARLAACDPVEASAELMRLWRRSASSPADAPDVLASLLSTGEAPGIDAWSIRVGASRQTIFRQFREVYGVGPNRYRVEARARRAWRLIMSSSAKLAEIATTTGFADQAHMQRDVKSLTGRPPGAWRRWGALQHSFNTLANVSGHHWQCLSFEADIMNA